MTAQKTFTSIDKSGDGILTHAEVARGLADIGCPASEGVCLLLLAHPPPHAM